MNKTFTSKVLITLVFIFIVVTFIFPTHYSSAQTSPSTPISPDTQVLIKQLQALIISLQSQINELKVKLAATQKDVEIVKSEIQFTKALARGTEGDEVKQLQEVLSKDPEVYPEGKVTGFFGPATEAAVKRFQEKYGIESRGTIGPKTRAKLNELITQGAGKSGVIPPGLLTAPGIQKKLTPNTPEPAQSASSTTPATPAQPIGQTGTTTVPAVLAVPGTTTIVTPITTIPLSVVGVTPAFLTTIPPSVSSTTSTIITPLPFSPVLSSNWQNIQLTNAPGASYWPSFAWTGTKYGAVWADSRDYTTGYGLRLYFSVFDANGQKIVADVKIGASTAGRILNPQIIWNGSNFAVVYDQYLSDTLESCKVYVTFVSVNGEKLGNDIPITDGCQLRPRITWNGNGYGVTWRSAYPYRVIFAGLDATGKKVVPDRVLTSVTSFGVDLFWINGEYQLWWVSRNDSGSVPSFSIPYISFIDINGNKIRGDVKVPTPSVSATELSIWKIVWDGVYYGTFFQGYVNGIRQQFFMRIDVAGTKIVDGVQITNNLTADGGLLTGTAVWGADSYGVLLQSGYSSHLHLMEIWPNGTIKTAPMQVDTSSGQAVDSAIIWTGSRYGVIWSDSRSPYNAEIYLAQGSIPSIIAAPPSALTSTPTPSPSSSPSPTPSPSPSPTPSPTTTTTDTTAPSTPTNLTATPVYNWHVTLTWSKSTDNVGVVGYKVYRNSTQLFSAATSSSLTTLTYRDWNVSAGTAYSYTVAAYDAAGNVSTQSSAISVTPVAEVISSPSPSPSPSPVSLVAPTSVSIGWYKGFGGQPPAGTYNMVVSFLYPGSNLSDVTSFRLYLKKPGDSSFLTGTYLNPSSIDSTCNNYVYSGTWKMRNCTTSGGGYWQIFDPGGSSSAYPIGEYNAYVVAVTNNNIVEGPASSIAKNIVSKTTVLSPVGAQTSFSPQLRWSIPSGWPAGIFWPQVYEGLNYVWDKAVSVNAGATQGLYTYDGPSLNALKTYYLYIWGEGNDSSGTRYFSMGESSPSFTVGATTTASATAANSSLATILNALNDTLSTLQRMLLMVR